MEIRIRPALPSDFDHLADVMFHAVHDAKSRYTKSQRLAWVPEPRRGKVWAKRLGDQVVILAEEKRRPVGFISLTNEGYIDFAYVLPLFQGQGVFRKLYFEVEALAKSRKLDLVWVHASLNAESAFRSVGFVVRCQESVAIGNEMFDRFVMEKQLAAGI